MGVTKTELFTTGQNEIAVAAKAFAHPARVAIVEYLLDSKTCINGDLVIELGLSQSTISQHLRELKEIGIIRGTIDGSKKCYCIDQSRWEEISTMFTRIFDRYSPLAGQECC